ncbi:PREDICTED: jacalin-related lectin 3 isoform X2 [Tarenaya hassleriana]|uniref:jacalin-related lectin 3 isoform X2 n=1 Tax=Tarenaya hassleriana TaxID=28532 RepID=UPI00053C5B9A|nr:PREDICTED: jacalin-related lectin 3 isoform X2 [Tarenaya hassleriana]
MSGEGLGKKPTSVGPWGGQSGSPWDDGVYSSVRQIVIAHGSGIDSIQIEYDKNGKSVWGDKHGGKGGNKFDKVKLEYPDEYLTSVHGTYGSFDVWGTLCVRSLTFESNRRKYGPFGSESGTYFSLPKSEAKIVGFHGKTGWYLDAIGVHIQPLHKENSSKIALPAQYHVTNGNEKLEYSVIQGSVGQSFDIVVAVKQKDSTLLPSVPRDQAVTETKHKLADPEKSHPKTEGVSSNLEEGGKTYGPWGGTGGTMFDDGSFTGIRQINLSRNVGIVSIKACYDRNGQVVWGSKHGGTGGFKHDKVVFDFPSEVLTRITGTYGSLMYMGPNVIRSLTFYTNKGKHGPYGEEQGPSFTNKIGEGKIVGFLGREGLFLDAIGVHVHECKITPLKPSPYNAIVPHNSQIAEIENSPWANKLVLAGYGQSEEVSRGVVKEPAPCGPGPWGGEGGKPWDDGVFSGIKQIFVTRGETAITSIQVEYDRNGQSVWSVKHGGNNNGGVATHRIKLECPHEVLTCLSGYYGPVSNSDTTKVVKSVSFYTSRGKYGPYGEENGTYYTSTKTEGKVVGFHGRSSSYLDAIGVHMQHWLGNHKPYKSSYFKLF